MVDESFADFSDELDNSLIEQKFIETYRRLYVMKSISKSYGVPGLRLGILVSSDTEAIAAMKKMLQYGILIHLVSIIFRLQKSIRKIMQLQWINSA